MGGVHNKQASVGGPLDRTRTGAIRRAVLLGLADGRTSLNALVRRLKEPKTTLLRARDFLLSEGAIERSSTPPGCFYSKGQGYDRLMATLEGGPAQTGVPVAKTGVAGVPPRTWVLLTNEEKTFQVKRSPAEPIKAPGCYKGKTVSKVPNFWFSHLDADGRSWTMRVALGREKQSVTAYPPKMRRNQIPESPEGWQASARNWVSKEVHRWASNAGFDLDRSRQAIRDTRPPEYALPNAAPQGFQWGVPGQTHTWVDETPVPRTVESADEAVMAELEVMAPTMAQFRQNFRVIFPWMDRMECRSKDHEEAAYRALEVMQSMTNAQGAMAAGQALQQGFAAQFQSVASSSPSTQPRDKPGVDYV